MTKYEVEVTYTVCAKTSVTVDAISKEEAKAIALCDVENRLWAMEDKIWDIEKDVTNMWKYEVEELPSQDEIEQASIEQAVNNLMNKVKE